jgi:hypothetical protein
MAIVGADGVRRLESPEAYRNVPRRTLYLPKSHPCRLSGMPVLVGGCRRGGPVCGREGGCRRPARGLARAAPAVAGRSRFPGEADGRCRTARTHAERRAGAAGFQIRVRSSSSRRQVCIARCQARLGRRSVDVQLDAGVSATPSGCPIVRRCSTSQGVNRRSLSSGTSNVAR